MKNANQTETETATPVDLSPVMGITVDRIGDCLDLAHLLEFSFEDGCPVFDTTEGRAPDVTRQSNQDIAAQCVGKFYIDCEGPTEQIAPDCFTYERIRIETVIPNGCTYARRSVFLYNCTSNGAALFMWDLMKETAGLTDDWPPVDFNGTRAEYVRAEA